MCIVINFYLTEHPCDNYECYNGGTCKISGLPNSVVTFCVCPSEFTGIMCEEKIYEAGNYASYFQSCVFSITLSTRVPPLLLLFLPLVLLLLILTITTTNTTTIFCRFLSATAKVASVTAIIFIHIILHPAFRIYDFHIFITTLLQLLLLPPPPPPPPPTLLLLPLLLLLLLITPIVIKPRQLDDKNKIQTSFIHLKQEKAPAYHGRL